MNDEAKLVASDHEREIDRLNQLIEDALADAGHMKDRADKLAKRLEDRDAEVRDSLIIAIAASVAPVTVSMHGGHAASLEVAGGNEGISAGTYLARVIVSVADAVMAERSKGGAT